MAAAEYRFQSPPPSYVCWQELCINAFNFYPRRWNTSTCGGGLLINFKTVDVQYCTVPLWLSRHAELHRWLKHLGTADFWLPRRNRHLLQPSPFPNSTNIMFETQNELSSTCNVDQYSMKVCLARYLASISLLALFTVGSAPIFLRISAIGAAAACTTGPYGNMCGFKWYINGSDGTSGLGQQLSAVEVMYALLVNLTEPPMRFKIYAPEVNKQQSGPSHCFRLHQAALLSRSTTPIMR
jgi:hypothetical protein